MVRKHQCDLLATMSRLTITLSEARYRALKEAAAQRSKTPEQALATADEHVRAVRRKP